MIIVQFNAIESVMMTIHVCASDIDSLIIVYEYFGGTGGGGGRPIYCRFQFQTTLMVIRPLQRAVKRGYTPLLKGNSMEQ